MQDLTELVTRLRADNERLQRERAEAPGPLAAQSSSIPPSVNVTPAERLVFIPRERKCPMFRGRSGIGFEEWEEEVQASIRARHLSSTDQAFFLYDHLEGEAREEIKYRSNDERGDPDKITAILRELYGCAQSHVSLQEAFFSRKQQEGESLLEFSLALMSLMGKIRQVAPNAVPNAEVMLRDQFIEYVNDVSLRRELKQLARRQPTLTLLDVRREAIRWEREGMTTTMRGRSQSVSSAYGILYGVQGESGSVPSRVINPDLVELKEMLKRQQEQLNLLTHTVTLLQGSRPPRQVSSPPICRRCQQPGHFARDCEGQRVAFRPRSTSLSAHSLPVQRSTQSNQAPENWHPPRC